MLINMIGVISSGPAHKLTVGLLFDAGDEDRLGPSCYIEDRSTEAGLLFDSQIGCPEFSEKLLC